MSQLEPETVVPERPRQPAPFGPWNSHRPPLLPFLRWPLLVVVLVGISAWLFLTPRHSSAGAFAQDLQDGSVRSYEVGSTRTFDRFRGLQFNDGATERQELAWCTGTLSCYRVDLDELARFPDGDANGPSDQPEAVPPDGLNGSTDAVNGDMEVVAQFLDTYATDGRPTAHRSHSWTGPLGVAWALTWLVMLWVLITGPQPRRVTKWAGFWILCLPGGLGMLSMLTREAPWSRRTAADPEPPPGPWPARWTGGWTFIAVGVSSGFLRELPTLVSTLLP